MNFPHAAYRLPLALTLAGSAVAAPTWARPAQVEDLGSLAGQWASPNDISADGSVIVGTRQRSISPDRSDAYRWTLEDGQVVLETLNGADSAATGVSADGRYAMGAISNSRSVRWGPDGTVLDLGTVPGGAFTTWAAAISADGAAVVGQAAVQNSNWDHAYLWTGATGMVDLHPPTAAAGSWGLAVSADGSNVIVATGPANFSLFIEGLHHWSAGSGFTQIQLPAVNRLVSAVASDDADVIAATAWLDAGGYQPARWTQASGLVGIGPVFTSPSVRCVVSGDGSVVFGQEPGGAFRWTEATGYQLVIADPNVKFTSGSVDGSTLYGYRRDPSTSTFAALRWTAATGAEELPTLGGALNQSDAGFYPTRSPFVSADGQTATVRSRTPSAELRAIRWRADGVIGSTYCGPAAPNSVSAQGGSMRLSGANTVSLGAMELIAADLPPFSFGFFIASPVRDFQMSPGGAQGNLCLGGAIGRFVAPEQIQLSGPLGRIALTINPGALPTPNGPILPPFGETWNFQAWYRDANPTATSNFTSGASAPIF